MKVSKTPKVDTRVEEIKYQRLLRRASIRLQLFFYCSLLAGIFLICYMIFIPERSVVTPASGELESAFRSVIRENSSLKDSLSRVLSIHELTKGENLRASRQQTVKITLCLANLLILISFLFLLPKKSELLFKPVYKKNEVGKAIASGQRHYSSLLAVMKNVEYSEDHAIKAQNRVNLLVRQFIRNLNYYAVFLILVYLLFALDVDPKAPSHKYLKIGEDIFNYLSAVFVYLSFKVLFNKTLTDSNERYAYYIDAMVFSVLYFGVYIVFGIASSNEIYQNLLSLTTGVGNGLAMILLFSRYISMGFMVKKMKEVSNARLFSIGIIYLLPIYSVVQPLFGNFHITAFGATVFFQDFVFLICCIGKLFFLYATYTLVRKKILHLFLHMVIVEHDATIWFEDCFILPNRMKSAMSEN